jgi:protein-tyrosine-phosphatase
MPQDLIFVCTGNICRSPMAEYLFREIHKDAPSDWQVSSAGVAASYGIPASRFAVEVLEEVGVDLNPHRSQPIMPQQMSTASLLVVMTRNHQAYLRDMYPSMAGKVRLLMSFKPDARELDVIDPIGLSRDVYRYVRDEITGALEGLSQFIETVTT